MIRGFYSAAAGALTQLKNINVISNNISNSTTTGFKTQSAITSSFREHMVSRINDKETAGMAKVIGPGSFMTVAIGEYTDYTQGSIDETKVPTNMAINGNGFFLVESEKHGAVMTRNGAFNIDNEGYLNLPGVGRVLNDGEQPIALENTGFKVSGAGEIIGSEGEVIDTLYIGAPQEGVELKKVGEDCFYSEDGYDRADQRKYQVIGAALERSNTDVARELTQLMAGQRNFQSCTQVVKMYDKLNEQSVQIGRLG